MEIVCMVVQYTHTNTTWYLISVHNCYCIIINVHISHYHQILAQSDKDCYFQQLQPTEYVSQEHIQYL